MRRASLLPLLVLCLGCKKELITGIQNEPGGNPLVPGVALFPFPSDFYLQEDASSATGRRLVLPDEAMPEGLSAATFADADGFTRAPAILAWFEGGLDPASLPADPPASVADDSSILLLREGDWAPVPLLAELDQSTTDPAQQSLILRPQVVLQANTGHVVILRDSLRSADGTSIPPVSEAFRALRDGIETDNDAVEAQRDDFEQVNAAIAAAGLDPQEVLLAWRFHTRSAEQLTVPLLAMHDAAMVWDLSDWQISSDAWDGDGQNRLVEGTFTAPDFLAEDGRIHLDGDGQPVVQGVREAPFLLTIPVSAASETRPVIAFGHGFFSSRDEPTWHSLNSGLQTWRMSAITTDFLGFCEDDFLATLALFGSGLDRFGEVADQQAQSHIHFTLLGRLVAEELSSVVQADDGTPLLDASAVHYMGISNGGTQGFTILAASPFFQRGVLVVPGGAWSHMLQRATQWGTMGVMITDLYDDAREMQASLSLLQLSFDPIDAINWVELLTVDRPAGREPVAVTLHEAVGDCQVSNMVTEWVARAGDIPLVTPSPRDVWGLQTVTAAAPEGADVGAALFIYDEGYAPLPDGNLPPDEDNGAHESLRQLPAYLAQVGAFLEDGTMVQVCDGACDPD